MSCYGWTGKILRVDLTRRTTSVEDWDRSWIGGKGFGQWALFDEEPVDGEEFDPQRMLIFSSGPLNGTIAPSSSRLNISSRNLLTGGCSTSSAGGFFSPEMKYAGFDAVVIMGASEAPVYLMIEDGKAELRPATHLWGMKIHETNRQLKKEIG